MISGHAQIPIRIGCYSDESIRWLSRSLEEELLSSALTYALGDGSMRLVSHSSSQRKPILVLLPVDFIGEDY